MNRCRKLLVISILLLMVSLRAISGEIRIGLFYGSQVESFVFSTIEGNYMLMCDGKPVAAIKKGTMFYIERSGSKLAVRDTSISYGVFSEIFFKGISLSNVFQVKPVFPSLPPKESEDNLAALNDVDGIRLINSLDIEKYIPGTVESEGGSGALPEYYKAQAVIVRTFAIKNYSRHAHEGFNLCDGVHCQVYNGKSRMNKEIYIATSTTAGEILVDKRGQPVMTAYHSNCGGITGSASMVWNKDLNYLAPVKDPFCDKASGRNWSKTVPFAQWTDYIHRRGFKGSVSKFQSTAESGRQKYLDPEDRKLLMSDIREEFKLKSSYFHIEPGDGTVIIIGHGYGHGLGLCQQGAMEMARVGYTYVDMLMFYFRNLTLKRP